MNRLSFKAVVVITALSMVLAFAAIVAFTQNEQQRRDAQAERRLDNAQSVLFNCRAIEDVKTELRGSLVDSLRQLPRVAYYKNNPNELSAAIRNTKATIERFSAFDCFSLPTVRSAGLKPYRDQTEGGHHGPK